MPPDKFFEELAIAVDDFAIVESQLNRTDGTYRSSPEKGFRILGYDFLICGWLDTNDPLILLLLEY